MKKIILLVVTATVYLLHSCSNKSVTDEIPTTKTPPPTGINGDWTLTKITGGFAGVNESFAGTILYNFNTTSNTVTVNNNYAGTSIINGLATGTYPISFSGTNEISVNSQNGHYTITGNTLYIDENVVADGFSYTFQRFLDCGTPDSCTNYNHAFVINATVPTTAIVNIPIQIPITFSINNGCGGFGNIVETNFGNIKTLTVNAKYVGCVCTQVMGEITTSYNFTPTTTGIQIIKIAQPDGTFLNYNINVTN
jgi:hypothetical protein